MDEVELDLREQILRKYGIRFRDMLKHFIRFEAGKDLDVVMRNDLFWYGDLSTKDGRWLCGYTDGKTGASKKDKGGETKYGFAQNSHKNLVVRDLIFPDVVDLYYELYATPMRYEELKAKTADVVLDIAVGSGPGKAIRMLQKVLKITQDGIFGPRTLEIANEYDDHILFELLSNERAAFYHRIVFNDPTQEIFIDGWINRVNGLKEIV